MRRTAARRSAWESSVVTWRRIIPFVAVAMLGLGLPEVAMAAPTVTISAAPTATVNVAHAYAITVKPVPTNAVAIVHVATSSGWVKVGQTAVDSKGQAKGTVVSSVTGKRSYRAAIVNRTNGKVLAYSSSITITWAPLKHTATLTCAKPSAPARVNVACSITVTPSVQVAGLAAQLQVMGRVSWVSIDTWKVPTTGTISTSVAGLEPGIGRYHVRLLRAGTEVSVSNTVTITWT